ncbi:MAG: T9SS type A sorting domain-containing protein [Candidatus Cloacimonetes bacterium]|nr:T9SS type A sorting domain-containing protein [Candidatus Cloacimonadota bacterium]MCF7814323.1 T9SS type A sorting domain-containing protein [Candidatus Cloacimonadota bacterium]MCF7868985.1 T9SS type A sorting domain-containing protein [Candidatus Cloacimonadota bacterium]MCF7884379.1 T9SS type A sorting domain-containing protein [Candidatus Cloacimonadota bacterium]
MKKIILAIIYFIMSYSLIATIRTVWPGGTYSTIQAAVNAALDDDTILVYDGVYEEYIEIPNGKTDLIFESVNGPDDCIISAPYFWGSCLNAQSHVERFEGFTVTGASWGDAAVVFHDGVNTITNCIFEDNDLSNGNILESWNCDDHVKEISYCIFRNNSAQYAIYLNEDYSLNSNPEAYGNYKNNLYDDGIFYIMNASSNYHGNFENNTFVDSPYGLYLYLAADASIKNCIFSSAGITIGPYGSDVTISYSCFTHSGYQNTPYFTWGSGNLVNTDPKFCPEEPYEYYLLEGSPCIDAGDPNTTGGDVRIDIGCFESSTDIKYCKGEHWNWLSFPRLEREDDEDVNVPPILEEFLNWPFIDLNLLFYSTEQNPVLEYDQGSWDPTSYNVKSSYGYKLYTAEEGYHYLPLEGYRLGVVANNPLDYNLVAGVNTENWMGYWLPESQNIVDAFGDDFWTYVEEVWAEDWYYNKNSNNRGFGQAEPVSESVEGKTLEYGKGYIVRFERTTQINNFYWTSSGTAEEPESRGESENFAFSEAAEYEVIDVVDIPEEVMEIGVFQDDVCVGAVVVDDECEQILVYPDGVSREPIPYNFEIVTNVRSLNIPVKSYQVLNPETGEFEEGSVISGQQNNSVVMFGNIEEEQNETPNLESIQLKGNYPNPFNPTTEIYFSLPLDQHIDLIIYNTKGQIVRKLAQGNFTTGEHSVSWDGKDVNGKNVGSGIYLYKLLINKQEISKKMLLLK